MKRTFLGVLGSGILLACVGCEPSSDYPLRDSYADPGGWLKVTAQWKREYGAGHVIWPQRPKVIEHIAPALLKAKRPLRIVVAGVVQEPLKIRPGAAAARLGIHSLGDTRYLQSRTDPNDRVEAGKQIDIRKRLVTYMETALSACPGFEVVDRTMVQDVIREQDLKALFDSSDTVPRLKGIKAADLLLVARGFEQQYLLYCWSQDGFIGEQLRCTKLSVRAVSAADGSVQWSAQVFLGPAHMQLCPVVFHKTAQRDLPPALNRLTSVYVEQAFDVLLQRLLWKRGGKEPPMLPVRAGGSHYQLDWLVARGPRAGVLVTTESGKVMVKDVVAGSGAAQGGLKVGDEITHVNGDPLGGSVNRFLLLMVRGKVVPSARLGYRRDGKDCEATVKLSTVAGLD